MSTESVTPAVNSEIPAVGEVAKFVGMAKGDVVAKFRSHAKDCGSPEVQLALLTARLATLTTHAARAPKDYHSQRGMMKIISRRKVLLAYLKDVDVERYRKIVAELGLRK